MLSAQEKLIRLCDRAIADGETAEALANHGETQCAFRFARRLALRSRGIARTLMAQSENNHAAERVLLSPVLLEIPPSTQGVSRSDVFSKNAEKLSALRDVRMALRPRKDFLSWTHLIAALAASVILTLLTVAIYAEVSQAYKPADVEAQPMFFAPPFGTSLGRVDLGRNGALMVHHPGSRLPHGTQIYFRNFPNPHHEPSPGANHIRFFLEAPHRGEIEIRLPSHLAVSSVALYLWGHDSFVRVSHITSEDFEQVIHGAQQGTWIIIPVTEAEREQGYKKLVLQAITGNGVAISGLALIGESSDD